MKCFSTTYADFIKFNRKPNEDFYLISKKYPIFVIADGVTQAHFPTGEYAFPKGAQTVAKIFCYTVSEFLENNFEKRKVKILIKKAFNLANKKIEEINEIEEITEKMDYWIYDYFDTVGIVGIIRKNTLYYGYVGDCGLAIFDQKNNLKFQTKDQIKHVLEKVKKIYKNWSCLNKKKRIIILHRDFRNNRSRRGYGSFSGEDGVKNYYLINSITLTPGDLVVFYSDGFLNYFQFPEFIEILRQRNKKALDSFTFKKAKEDYQEFGTDRTLISSIF
ncbi:hypothetical protein AMJ49_00785 [Parcubacteria bacterium DG_74_2]|nr:MAG: hypothetical protein AMJ49_00785 [Parcubacteria bacterium DG_74_2]